MPAITDDTATPKADGSNGNNSDKTLTSNPSNLTDNQNKAFAFERQDDQVTNNSVLMERAATLVYKSKKSENTTRVDSENRLLDLMENVTSSSTAEKESNNKSETNHPHGSTSQLIMTTNWTLRDTLDVMVISWMFSFCTMVLHLTLSDYIKDNIELSR